MKNGPKREAALRKCIEAASDGGYEYAEWQVDEGDPVHDTEEDGERRFNQACDGFVAAMALGFASASVRAAAEKAPVARESYARAMIALEEGIASLPEHDRVMIFRRWFDGVDLDEVARERGIGCAIVHRQYNGAMDRLGGWVQARAITRASAEGRSALQESPAGPRGRSSRR